MSHVLTPIATELECLVSAPSDWRALGEEAGSIVGRVALLKLRVIKPQKDPSVMDIGRRQSRPAVAAEIG